MADVFISYAHEDRPAAQMIQDVLDREGLSVWWDDRIEVGTQFDSKVEEELRRAAAVIVLWSDNSATSAWVRNEAGLGSDEGKLIPIRLDDVDLPLPHRLLKTIDLHGLDPDQAALKEVVVAAHRYRLATREAFAAIQSLRLRGAKLAAPQLQEVIQQGSSHADAARLELAHHEFARLGDHRSADIVAGLRSEATSPWIVYGLSLLEALCRLAQRDIASARQLTEACGRPRNGDADDALSVSLVEILVFGALDDRDRVTKAWEVLSDSADAVPSDDALAAKLLFDRAVRAVVYGAEPVGTIVESLDPNQRGLIHYSAAVCKSVRKANAVIDSLVERAVSNGWTRVPQPTAIRNRCRQFEMVVLPTAGTLFGHPKG